MHRSVLPVRHLGLAAGLTGAGRDLQPAHVDRLEVRALHATELVEVVVVPPVVGRAGDVPGRPLSATITP